MCQITNLQLQELFRDLKCYFVVRRLRVSDSEFLTWVLSWLFSCLHEHGMRGVSCVLTHVPSRPIDYLASPASVSSVSPMDSLRAGARQQMGDNVLPPACASPETVAVPVPGPVLLTPLCCGCWPAWEPQPCKLQCPWVVRREWPPLDLPGAVPFNSPSFPEALVRVCVVLCEDRMAHGGLRCPPNSCTLISCRIVTLSLCCGAGFGNN